MSLDLYAKVEPYLGIGEATLELHAYYLDLIQEYQPRSVLDVGCGRGDFMLALKQMGIETKGIDLSQNMIDIAQSKGLDASCEAIQDHKGSYDLITSIFDVLNFLDKQSLEDFLTHVDRLLKSQGYFIADINTLFGFEEVAVGTLAYDDDERSLMVSAEFEKNCLMTDFVYFEKASKTCYTKESSRITQYYYTINSLLALTDLELLIEMPIALYGDEPDKSILIFQKK